MTPLSPVLGGEGPGVRGRDARKIKVYTEPYINRRFPMCRVFAVLLGGCALGMSEHAALVAGKEDMVRIDKDKGTVTIDARIAPRKLAYLKGEVYPIEVIACWAHPKGKKAHETIVTIEAMPSAVHKAIEALGLKPGMPIMGGDKEVPQGPDVNLYIEIPTPEGMFKRVTMDRALIDSRTGKAFPKSVKWRFTGSALAKPDPNKDDKAYGADLSGTLAVIFPVSDLTVLQTSLPMEYEKLLKLETNTKVLPKEGTAVRLVIEVPRK
jgi:hypothetical protein